MQYIWKNIVIDSNTWEDHLSHIQALFERLEKANLTVNSAKCEFTKVMGQGHVRPVHGLVSVVDEFLVPTTKKKLMRIGWLLPLFLP